MNYHSSCSRASSPVASHGYLSVNLEEGLTAGRRTRMTWTPVRFLPIAAQTHYNAVAAEKRPDDIPPTLWAKRRAIKSKPSP
ncbi:hypothetical protein [Paraburkholderia acidiphila]|uniref:Uncharacterized protein n=1 Tax=Paraburkholderia acidiphila TaxID=2571747 RepID=A0A7Z2JC57_9BURK|nr:hypothetical protein [Paraburkholderia acidiphila]QGZ58553.1 hypothetical protein FAZ97_26575 [Paraburkholderia acidiphila]